MTAPQEPRPGECWCQRGGHPDGEHVAVLIVGEAQTGPVVVFVFLLGVLWHVAPQASFLNEFERCTQHPPRLGDAAFHGEAPKPTAEGPPWPPADE